MVRAIKDFLARYFSCGEEEFDFRGGIVYRNGEQLYTLPELAKLCKAKGVKLTVHDYHRLPKTMWPREDCNENHVIPPKDYRIHDTNSYLTLAVAIKVDPVTKRIKVLKMIEAADIGTVINPEAARRQLEGGMIMTLGMALDEDFVVENGVSKTDMLSKYKMIQMDGTPDMEVIFVDNYDPLGPKGAKGVGEMGMLPVCPAIANAYYDATGVRIRSLPLHKHLP